MRDTAFPENRETWKRKGLMEGMPARSKGRTARMLKAIAVLLRNTTWKCGRVERLVVDYLRKQFRTAGRVRIPVKEMLQHFSLTGKRKSEFLDAIERLEKRRIIKVM